MKETRFIREQIERDRKEGKSSTGFVERFLIRRLNQDLNYSVSSCKDGWEIVLKNYQSYRLSDFECVPNNELATEKTAKLIEKEWTDYMSHNLTSIKSKLIYRVKHSQLKKGKELEKNRV